MLRLNRLLFCLHSIKFHKTIEISVKMRLLLTHIKVPKSISLPKICIFIRIWKLRHCWSIYKWPQKIIVYINLCVLILMGVIGRIQLHKSYTPWSTESQISRKRKFLVDPWVPTICPFRSFTSAPRATQEGCRDLKKMNGKGKNIKIQEQTIRINFIIMATYKWRSPLSNPFDRGIESSDSPATEKSLQLNFKKHASLQIVQFTDGENKVQSNLDPILMTSKC